MKPGRLEIILHVFLVACMLLSVFVRWRLQHLPLERDEGEYAYAGQLIQEDIPPYEGVYNMKFPGVYFCYAVIEKLFGETIPAIRYSLIAVNLICTLLCYFIAKNWFLDKAVACISAGCYSLLTLSDSVEGLIVNAEQFVVLFALSGFLALQRETQKSNGWYIFAGGFFMGLSLIMKQHGMVFAVFAFFWLLIQKASSNEFRWKHLSGRVIIFAGGFMLPFIVLISWLYHKNVLQKFYELTFLYARDYISQNTWKYSIAQFSFMPIFNSNPEIWIFCAIGMAVAWMIPGFKKKALVLWLLAVFSCLGVIPGFYFRPHYFNLILPAASLFVAAGFYALRKHYSDKKDLLVIFCMIVVLSSSCYFNYDYYFKLNTHAVSRKMYPAAPFTITPQIGNYIRENSPGSAYVGIIGCEPEIYFYSRRKSATSLLYLYPLLENQRFQKQMVQQFLSQLDSVKPEFLVFDDNFSGWMRLSEDGNTILRRYEQLARSFYEPCIVAENTTEVTAVFRRANESDLIEPLFKDRLLVLRKKRE